MSEACGLNKPRRGYSIDSVHGVGVFGGLLGLACGHPLD